MEVSEEAGVYRSKWHKYTPLLLQWQADVQERRSPSQPDESEGFAQALQRVLINLSTKRNPNVWHQDIT